jgi:probable rRNA maturation factor
MSSSKSDQEIIIHLTRNFNGIDVSLPRLRKIVKTVCRLFGENATSGSREKAKKYEISVAIVDDAEFQKINHQFLKRKSISDCLSFDLSDDNGSACPKTFELVVNGQMALRQAHLRGHSEQAELALYIIHSLLHNFGFDDLKPNMAEKMHKTEEEILQQLGYDFVYNKRSKSKEKNQKL